MSKADVSDSESSLESGVKSPDNDDVVNDLPGVDFF
jgi:hypothetical protein